jgi:hypothetical protein
MNPNSQGAVELETFGIDQIRNFSIIAHVGEFDAWELQYPGKAF